MALDRALTDNGSVLVESVVDEEEPEEMIEVVVEDAVDSDAVDIEVVGKEAVGRDLVKEDPANVK